MSASTASSLSFNTPQVSAPPRTDCCPVDCLAWTTRTGLTLAVFAGWAYLCDYVFRTMLLYITVTEEEQASQAWIQWTAKFLLGLLAVGLVLVSLVRGIWRRRWGAVNRRECFLQCWERTCDATYQDYFRAAIRTAFALVLWCVGMVLLFLAYLGFHAREQDEEGQEWPILFHFEAVGVSLGIGIVSFLGVLVFAKLVVPPSMHHDPWDDASFFFFDDDPTQIPLTIGLISAGLQPETEEAAINDDDASTEVDGYYREISNL